MKNQHSKWYGIFADLQIQHKRIENLWWTNVAVRVVAMSLVHDKHKKAEQIAPNMRIFVQHFNLGIVGLKKAFRLLNKISIVPHALKTVATQSYLCVLYMQIQFFRHFTWIGIVKMQPNEAENEFIKKVNFDISTMMAKETKDFTKYGNFHLHR